MMGKLMKRTLSYRKVGDVLEGKRGISMRMSKRSKGALRVVEKNF